jgi:cytochrome c5
MGYREARERCRPGNPALSNADVKAAVDYMVAQSK